MRILPLLKNPNVQRESCGGVDILSCVSGHSSAVLYFHGFPGPFEALPEGQTRAVDHIFERLRDRVDFFYPLYTLKKGAPFSFMSSFIDGQAALDLTIQKRRYDSVYLVGQSWGTVVAMPLVKKFAFKKIILVTPYLSIPKGADGAALVAHYSKLHPELLEPQRVPELADEFDKISNCFTPMSFLLGSNEPKTVFAAERDEIVPLKQIEKSVAQLRRAKLVVLRHEQHTIENKAEFGEQLCNEIH